MAASFLLGRAEAQTVVPVNSSPSSQMQKAAEQKNTHLHYSVFVHGYHALNADADYVMQPWGYGIETHLYTAGLASWFLTLNLLSSAQGRFSGDEIAPVSFSNKGFSRGEERRAHIDFDLSGPHVTVLFPPEKKREPLPEVELKQAVDMLSYLIALTHRMEFRQDCTFGKPIFDGVHLSYLDMHGPINTSMPKDHSPFFKDDALRCDFTGRQIGGFSIGSPFKAAQSAPHPGSVWFVRDEKVGFLPVRIEFNHYKMGLILVVLQSEPQISTVSRNQVH